MKPWWTPQAVGRCPLMKFAFYKPHWPGAIRRQRTSSWRTSVLLCSPREKHLPWWSGTCDQERWVPLLCFLFIFGDQSSSTSQTVGVRPDQSLDCTGLLCGIWLRSPNSLLDYFQISHKSDNIFSMFLTTSDQIPATVHTRRHIINQSVWAEPLCKHYTKSKLQPIRRVCGRSLSASTTLQPIRSMWADRCPCWSRLRWHV